MQVIVSEDNLVKFSNGLTIRGEGEYDCCAVNYLDFEQLPVGTVLPDLTVGQFVDYINLKSDGFSLKDSEGTPKWVQARSNQNGYYSDRTDVFVTHGDKEVKLGTLSGVLNDY